MNLRLEEAAPCLVDWLERRVVESATGAAEENLSVEPSGRFWLGCLASEEAVIELGLGDRGERLDPCAAGIRVRVLDAPPWTFAVRASARAWIKREDGVWRKSPEASVELQIEVPGEGEFDFGRDEFAVSLGGVTGADGLAAEVRVEARRDEDARHELTVLLVNASPKDSAEFKDTKLYECRLLLEGLDTEPFLLESLPDSFRYDRRVPAYGVNCGVRSDHPGTFEITDVITVDRRRPAYWHGDGDPPDLRFAVLANNPLPSLHELATSLRTWGERVWGDTALDQRATDDLWTTAMRAEAESAAGEFRAELERVNKGLDLLRSDDRLLRAFRLMNEAIEHSANGRYDGWRPFQVGFLLANLASVAHPEQEAEIADIVWFATGGGKTETYLGLLILAAFLDRMTGKLSGVTAWSRFPLRMLSLQQTQRFANAMAGAEIVRRRERIPGDPFSTGFLVGQGGTPNRLRPDPRHGEPDPDDDSMPGHYQVLLECPFCRDPEIQMAFDRLHWTLEHQCTNEACPWPEAGLPFYVVDEEIYRFLPTVIVGTLDKVATISMQAAMRGLVGAPLGRCRGARHGYTYASRSATPRGCLVPGCRQEVDNLDLPPERFGPSFRLQDELHLLKDSLGAVDAHYEALLDHLQSEICGTKAKILASSATLTGYEKQVKVLYQRAGRVFPQPGPSQVEGFWSRDTRTMARRFVAVAPRGVTLEYAVDRTATVLQNAIRELMSDPARVCGHLGIDPVLAPELVSLYGVDVVYGNTLRDLDAVLRSLETQVPVEGTLGTASLTGRTDFDEVRATLGRLERPEEDFQERLHVVAASSMMSHGVDIDRLNVMVMLGLPLTTAEFIQATARIGRRWPGLVFVMHKVARERDAAMYRSFEKFVTQGDRFVEPVPITRRSRRVLERTIPGFELARILAIHEPRASHPLTMIRSLREGFEELGIEEAAETTAAIEALGFEDDMDEGLRDDLREWFAAFFRRLHDPPRDARFPSELSPFGGPMRSLRDVEEQAPIIGLVDR